MKKCFAIAFLAPICLGAQTVDVVKIGAENGVDEVVMVQTAREGKLALLPEHCFFSGADGAKLTGEQPGTDELNGSKRWSRIEGLRSPDQRIVFPLWLRANGEVTGKINGSGRFNVQLGEAQTAASGTFVFKSAKEGRVDLVLSPNGAASIESVELSGPGVVGAQLLRARWRPAAIHAGFTSSKLGGAKSRLWVMEVRPIFGEKDFYSPITTPFGYFGSTFNADHTSGGINFSMWSFQAGAPEPPLPQLSHLLAVGSPQASFGGFDHEGTGVKLRDWNPYEGQKIESTALALRVEPGKPYDTYTGWFLDQKTRQWRLYASGRKWSEKRSVENLLPGCFVEVPGPPHIQRSGHIPRAADIRGWCRDENGKWHTLDTMNGSKADANREQTNCLWTRSNDGWFRMAMGGMVHYRYPQGVDVTVPETKVLPDFMSPAALAALETPPTVLTIKRIARVGTRVHVELDLQTVAKDRSKARVFFGSEDGLTFEKRWKGSRDLGEIAPGTQRIAFDGAPTSGSCRILVTNDTGSYFTAEPGSWK
ncbi:MAG: DUF3472 domain-containing protein [Verrucomicrobiaceae bacterium]|nr:DUF3472 domain-containing protein [Verrucomicrobiaceae bacterium]